MGRALHVDVSARDNVRRDIDNIRRREVNLEGMRRMLPWTLYCDTAANLWYRPSTYAREESVEEPTVAGPPRG